jgi:ubiquinone/menaquinone biosynthesis C-methylase UbiE
VTDERKSIVASGYDAMADRYLAWSARIDDHARTTVFADFSERLAAGSAVLDLGCGAGIPSTHALAERFTVTGVDISARQLEAARRNVPGATFIQGDLATLDLPDASFDGVTAFYSISHVPRDEHAEVFRRALRWLRPGGLFLAALGAGDSPDWVGEWLGEPMFFSSFDDTENRRLVVAAGFELLVADMIDTPEPEGAVPFLWVLARRPVHPSTLP